MYCHYYVDINKTIIIFKDSVMLLAKITRENGNINKTIIIFKDSVKLIEKITRENGYKLKFCTANKLEGTKHILIGEGETS